MFIVRVIPIARGIFKDSLSFFSREALPPGSVASASVRGKRIPALVIESKDAREERFDVRSAGYSLKKLPTGKARKIFSEAFIRAAKDIALWHGVHEGIAIQALTSQTILVGGGRIEEAPPEREVIQENEEVKARGDVLILQAERGERVRTYRNLAREAFARRSSLVVIAPTIIEAETLGEELSRGIEERVFVITSDMASKKLINTWNKAVQSKESILIVGTPFVLSLPRADVDTFVIEREGARAYKKLERPHLDLRLAAERLARRLGARIIYADFPLRVETRYRVDSARAEELARLQARPSGVTTVAIVDTRRTEETKKSGRTFSTLSDSTKKAIRAELARGGRVTLFAARRGLAPLTVCNDCGTPVSDPITGIPMVLHKTPNGNVFISHRSGAIVPAHNISCKTCGGWNLVTLGIGIDRVAEEIRKSFPDTPTTLLTAHTLPKHQSAKKAVQRFFETPGSILLGTERMLPYLIEPVELSAVASIDSLLSVPAWRAHEHALSILFYLHERTENTFIVETREPEHAVMKALASGSPADFYRDDIAERERYGYPPFTLFIGLTLRGTLSAVEKLRASIKETFSDLDLVGPLPAEAITKTEWRSRAVIRLARNAWPDGMIAKRLTALSPAVEVTIDPDEIV